MNVCHLYYEHTDSIQAKKILDSFEDSFSIDISKVDEIEEFSVCIIEANKIDNVISTKIKKIFEKKSLSLIYFLVSNEYNLMLFQLAFLLKTKTIITASQDADKIIKKIKNDFKVYEEERIQNLLGKTVINTQHFMLFNNKKLFFASKKMFEEFESINLAQIEQKVCSKINLQELLLQEIISKESMPSFINKEISFHIKSTNLNKENEKLISLYPYFEQKQLIKTTLVTSRVNFIDILNKKIIEKKKNSDNIFSIITFQIENLAKLRVDYNLIEMEDFLKDFLIYIDEYLDKKNILSQYDSNLYIALFEDIEFETLKETASDFLKHISDFLNKQNFNPFIDLFILRLDEVALDDIIKTIDGISAKTLSKTRIANKDLHYVGNASINMSDSENIQHLLQSVFANSIDIKLLNIYKGLIINTSSKVIKITEDSIYVTFESLQGIVMMNERETVLQSSSFTKDIRAAIKYVNMDKKIAILEDFNFLNGNANSRKNNRVTTTARMPAVISHFGGTLSGDILDISVNSIAVSVKYAKIVDSIRTSDVKLSFVLPTKSHIDGQIKLVLDANVLFTSCKGDSCSIICNLKKDDANEAVLMEYIYDRQKEIITEIKKMVKRV